MNRVDQELLVMGLLTRICQIETGTPILRASDLSSGKRVYEGVPVLPKSLTTEQAEAVRRSEQLVELIRRGRIDFKKGTQP